MFPSREGSSPDPRVWHPARPLDLCPTPRASVGSLASQVPETNPANRARPEPVGSHRPGTRATVERWPLRPSPQSIGLPLQAVGRRRAARTRPSMRGSDPAPRPSGWEPDRRSGHSKLHPCAPRERTPHHVRYGMVTSIGQMPMTRQLHRGGSHRHDPLGSHRPSRLHDEAVSRRAPGLALQAPPPKRRPCACLCQVERQSRAVALPSPRRPLPGPEVGARAARSDLDEPGMMSPSRPCSIDMRSDSCGVSTGQNPCPSMGFWSPSRSSALHRRPPKRPIPCRGLPRAEPGKQASQSSGNSLQERVSLSCRSIRCSA